MSSNSRVSGDSPPSAASIRVWPHVTRPPGCWVAGLTSLPCPAGPKRVYKHLTGPFGQRTNPHNEVDPIYLNERTRNYNGEREARSGTRRPAAAVDHGLFLSSTMDVGGATRTPICAAAHRRPRDQSGAARGPATWPFTQTSGSGAASPKNNPTSHPDGRTDGPHREAVAGAGTFRARTPRPSETPPTAYQGSTGSGISVDIGPAGTQTVRGEDGNQAAQPPKRDYLEYPGVQFRLGIQQFRTPGGSGAAGGVGYAACRGLCRPAPAPAPGGAPSVFRNRRTYDCTSD